MAAKINWHRYGTKLRHYHPMYNLVDARRLNSRRWAQRAWSGIIGNNGKTFSRKQNDMLERNGTVTLTARRVSHERGRESTVGRICEKVDL